MSGSRSAPRPPRWAVRVLSMIAAPYYRAELLGDLEEGFHKERLRHGVAQARRWYVEQTALSAMHLVAGHLAQSAGLRAAAALMLGMLASVAASVIVGELSYSLLHQSLGASIVCPFVGGIAGGGVTGLLLKGRYPLLLVPLCGFINFPAAYWAFHLSSTALFWNLAAAVAAAAAGLWFAWRAACWAPRSARC